MTRDRASIHGSFDALVTPRMPRPRIRDRKWQRAGQGDEGEALWARLGYDLTEVFPRPAQRGGGERR